MAKVALVSYDVQTIFGRGGGVGAFVTRWANLLQQAGEHVTIVMTGIDSALMRVDPNWRVRYRENGISLIELQVPPVISKRRPDVPTMRLAEIVTPALHDFDVAYFMDWGNTAFHLLRERRYSSNRGPVCVTVLHGPSEWVLRANREHPKLPWDLHLAYQERYSALHSNFVVSPSHFMVEHLKSLGWEFPGEVEVLGLPMPKSADAPPNNLTPSQIRKIVYFGRVEESKGIRNFVLALQHFAKGAVYKPEIVLLGKDADWGRPSGEQLLDFAWQGLREAGFKVSREASLDSENACRFLRENALETLCVIPSLADNHPYTVIEASLIPGLNLIACRSGGVPEILRGAERQLCDPLPMDLAERIRERVNTPLGAAELARYNWRAANERWLEFHRKAAASAKVRSPRALPERKLTVDVCVTYFQKAAYLGQLMESLEEQTETDFHVIAVNDGSPDAESNRVFEEQGAKASSRGWDFYRQENAFVDAARNSAARRGTGDLILFIDSDDVPARNAIARMREAMTLSGDDALICASYLFTSEKQPFDPATGEVLVPADETNIPLGMDLVGGLVNPCVFGASMFVIRRSVFEKVGGFRELRGAHDGHWEFYVRLALEGYKIDVLPELLLFYRQAEGSPSRTLPSQGSYRTRFLDTYEDRLRTAGLKGAALALAGLYRNSLEMEKEIKRYRDGTLIEGLRLLYRGLVPVSVRLGFHKLFLAPFTGPNRPPAA